ncbi:hypothetical protein [Actinomycetospora aeridis]|uniref:GIY-YIG domain-containing protein n=1 Tax=Actinomycetospora aeridis TaxID=3129231 RepID=A0ABU8N133_9PSEU
MTSTEALVVWIAAQRGASACDGVDRPPILVIDSTSDEPLLPLGIAEADEGAWRSDLRWTALYLFLDAAASPLYVGVSAVPDQRLVEHLGSPFAPDAAAVVVKWFSLRTLALIQETALIDWYAPPYNRSRDAEPRTRPAHLAVLVTPRGSRLHPYELALRPPSDLSARRSPSRIRRMR